MCKNTMACLISKLIARALGLFNAIILSFLSPVYADDIDLFDLSGCDIGERYRFVFIVDNSGSMSTTEFNQSKGTIDAVITEVLDSGLSDIQVAVVQYGSNNSGTDHTYNVTVPFTENTTRATNWQRAYGKGGTVRPSYYQDHQPASLAAMRRDGVYEPGGALDITDGTNVQFVFFTDAWRDIAWGCCSSIVADSKNYIPADVLSGFGEYDAIKEGSVLPGGIEGQFTLLHVAPTEESRRAGAAIASVTLSDGYSGTIEANPTDPEGSGKSPRRYIEGSLSSRDIPLILAMINEVIEEIRFPASFAAPAIAVSAFNENRHREDLYYSFFQPGVRSRWLGNVKKYRMRGDGVVVDKFGRPILDNETGLLAANSVSYWASVADGGAVGDGGFAALQPAKRNWYSDVGIDNTIVPINNVNQISASMLGAANNLERNTLVRWAWGEDSLDENSDGNTSDANRFVADSIHNGPVLLNYSVLGSTTNDVVYSANNLGFLHAVDAVDGSELWSYTPKEHLKKIKPYVDNTSTTHSYGLDGSFLIYSEFDDDPLFDKKLSKAYMYMSERRGGRRIHALDITNGSSRSNPVQSLWKITGGSGQYIDLAQTWSEMDYIEVTIGCPDACERKTVLLFAGGYNTIYDDSLLNYPVVPGPGGHGNAIYMADMETGELLWSAGNGGDHPLNLEVTDSIPAAPVPLDTDIDGDIEIIYFSDIAGNLWRIDLNPDAESFDDLHVGGGKIAALNPPGESLRFFNSINRVSKGSTEGASYLNLIIGSGNRADPLYDEPGHNRIHVVKDYDIYSFPTGEKTDPATGDLLPEYNYVRNADGTRSIITVSDLADYDAGAIGKPEHGYYRRLFADGEKILQKTLTTSGVIFMQSYVPPDPDSGDMSCSYRMGSSRLYLLDLDTFDFLDVPGSDENYYHLSGGIATAGILTDTGEGDVKYTSPFGESINLGDVLGSANQKTFRRFRRTGWVEKDGYH